jgi:hypothetical protein
MGVTYDKYGHCVLCHKDMIYEQVIGQKVTKRFSVDYDETEYLLDDNSKIMKSVQEGWEEEVKTLPWKEEKKKAYLDRYGKLEIVCFSGGIPEDILKEKHTDYMKKKEGKNGHNK